MHLKPHPLLCSLVAATVGIVGCSESNPQTNTASSKQEVVVSSSILCDLTEQIAQDTVELTCLMEREQDPHTYQTTLSDRKAMDTAALILYSGYELEPKIEGVVEVIETPIPKVAVYEQAVPDPILAEHHHHEHEHEGEEAELEPDPHVWHNVQNAIATAEIIESQLAKVNPEHAAIYAQNAEQLKGELEKLDTWVKKQVATIPVTQKTIVTTHDSFNYYVQAYGFANSQALQGISTEEKPTAARVKELTAQVKQAKIPTIFAEVTANKQVISAVAREAKVKLSEQELLTGALGAQGSGAETYIGMIATNTCTIVNGLGGQCSPF